MLEGSYEVLDGPDGKVDFVSVVEQFLVECVVSGFELVGQVFC